MPVIGVPHDHVRIRRSGVIGRRLIVEVNDVVEVDGIRCTSLLRTWAELAETLPVPHLTAVSDFLIARRMTLATRG